MVTKLVFQPLGMGIPYAPNRKEWVTAALAGASLAITHDDIDSRLEFNDKKDSFLNSINNNNSVIVYNTDYGYKVHILHTSITDEMKEKLKALGNENFEISFDNVSEHLDAISKNLPVRDYKTECFSAQYPPKRHSRKNLRVRIHRLQWALIVD